ncbi:hypothetical protein LTR62_008242 [Meristemomyces frigidus]|uniref:Uncharacterized protein n=1 Tax=Meristemomyces frigidus TaxID=1508187 RepID=A0AAN7TDP8_9PEZI|nr:hypothetical protein LTR62_008242 [Meristemomyces frigidus]
MKTSMALTLLSTSLATAAQSYFGVVADRSGSAIQYMTMNAGAGRIYLGGAPMTSCPDNIAAAGGCPADNSTNFMLGEAGQLEMGVDVPGGQTAYFTACGELSYTVPHANDIPEDATVTGWTMTPGASFGSLSYTEGLTACQDGDVYYVYSGDARPDCLSFNALTVADDAPAAWEYTY